MGFYQVLFMICDYVSLKIKTLEPWPLFFLPEVDLRGPTLSRVRAVGFEGIELMS